MLTNTSPRTAINWSRCGGTNHVYITADVSLKARHGTTPQAQITIDSIDGKIESGDRESGRGIQISLAALQLTLSDVAGRGVVGPTLCRVRLADPGGRPAASARPAR